MMKQSTPLYTLSGVVIHGRGVGKHVGTPTADLALGPGSHLPPGGVYASRAASGSVCWYGVTSVGRRPTLHNDCAPRWRRTCLILPGTCTGSRCFWSCIAGCARSKCSTT